LVSKYIPEGQTGLAPKKEEVTSGKLKLTIKEAKLTRDTEAMFNKMDPFVTLNYRE